MTSWPSSLTLPTGRVPLTIAAGIVCCLAFDAALLAWLQIGPPAGKSQLFFLELALLVAGGVVAAAAAFAAPHRLRPAVPAIFVVLAWHTGFQLDLSGDNVLVLSAFDMLVPLIALLALADRWYRDGTRELPAILVALVVFWAFAVWGVALSLARDVSLIPFLANLKSFLIYPLIALLIPLCLRTRRQLDASLGLLLLLVLERALEGLHEGAAGATKTLLADGQVVARIDGHMDSVNQYACYLLTGLLLLLALLVRARSTRVRLALAGPTLIVALALLLTFSRGAWLATLLGLLVLVAVMGLRRSLPLLGVIVLGIALLVAVQPRAFALIAGRLGRVDHSIQERQSYLALGLQVVERYPFGAGWGAAFVDTRAGLQPSAQAPWYHDDYLQIASEIGVPGLLSFLALWVAILRAALRTSRRVRKADRALLAGLMAASIAILLQAATEQMLWRPNIAPHFWIVAGFALAAAGLTSQSKSLAAQMVSPDSLATSAPSRRPDRSGGQACVHVPAREGGGTQ